MFKGTISIPKLYSTLSCLHPTGQTDSYNRSVRLPLPDPHHQSDRSHWPVRPVLAKPRVCTHIALKGATRQLPSLGVSLHHFPPLCISLHLGGWTWHSRGRNQHPDGLKWLWQQTLSILILSKAYPTMGIHSPYLDMHGFLARELFCRKASIVGSLLSMF